MNGMKLVVFDCDGTLVDGQHLILDAMHTASRVCDIAYPGDEAIRQIVGLSLLEAIEQSYPEEAPSNHHALKEAFITRFQQLRQREEDEEPLFEGVREFVHQLHEEGFLLGIATGKSRRGLISTLKNHGRSDYFLTLNTADDGPGKPQPSMRNNARQEVGETQENTYMIGDTRFDVQMELAAKERAVGV